eukprot:TRINITY_DN24107_c0_g1_i2.p1 TRINITY_DN24107_c0_g1~~TRINITY_DN24107_c0_g1_i2.p1  ORF type:complete len:147 (-),score=33.49 TRINITY_DN24107_c0_g1_i2:85-465(-)
MVTNTYHFVYKSVCDECGKMLEEERERRAMTEIKEGQSKKYSISMDSDYSSLRTRSNTPNCQVITQLTTPLLNSKLNSAYRKQTSGSYQGSMAYSMPYSKAGRSLSESSGPRRYRIDHRFQSRFYK